MRYAIGLDLGGTNIAAGLVDETRRIVCRDSVKTNARRGLTAILGDMAALCDRLCTHAGVPIGEISSIGVGTAGIVWNGEIKYASNLSLYNAPVAQALCGLTGRPVFLQNDANTAAYGEFMAGNAQPCRSMVLMTIGTGIGTGVILDGRIYSGFNGAAAELGHTILVPEGRPCTCGKRGCFEAYCSATGLTCSTREAMLTHPESEMWALCQGSLDYAGAQTAFLAQDRGDAAASMVVEQYLDALSIGVANVINLFQPEIFCIGGGVSRQGSSLLLPLQKRVEALSFSGSDQQRTRLTLAALGNDAGIIGAAMLDTMQQGEFTALNNKLALHTVFNGNDVRP